MFDDTPVIVLVAVLVISVMVYVQYLSFEHSLAVKVHVVQHSNEVSDEEVEDFPVEDDDFEVGDGVTPAEADGLAVEEDDLDVVVKTGNDSVVDAGRGSPGERLGTSQPTPPGPITTGIVLP